MPRAILALFCSILLFASPALAGQAPNVVSSVQLSVPELSSFSLERAFGATTFKIRASMMQEDDEWPTEDPAEEWPEDNIVPASTTGRTLNSQMALAVGVGAAYGGALVFGIIDYFIGSYGVLTGLGAMAGASIGVHLFSNARIGYEVLGAFLGLVVWVPVVVVLAFLGPITYIIGVLTWPAFPAVGAWIAAKKDSPADAFAQVSPMLLTTPSGKRVPGVAFCLRF
ncbi:MAG: hypothetical protein HN348_00865 [Proteobacteria bacterium]|mgnify:CR=1 FL=1|jgi:hypothetical protein|nr:hypothetical protein [Pseudomonadota bacterium]